MSFTAVPKILFETPVQNRHRNILAGLTVVLIVGACFLQGAWFFKPTRGKLQDRRFHWGDSDVTKLHYFLMTEGSMEVDRSKLLPSSTAVSKEVIQDGVPTISLVADHGGLYSRERGIVAHPFERGLRWERWASLSYFEGGRLKYETPAGLRIHGGKSRNGPIKSFAVLFRRTYSGHPRAEAAVFWDGQSPAIERLVLSNTDKSNRFLNALALEIADRAGCIASRSQPVRVFLNGERMGCGYFAMEHQSREFLRDRFGHDDFEWVRLKNENDERLSFKFDWLQFWLKTWPDEVTLEGVSKRFDLDNLCAWVFAVTLCDTRDEDQGGYFLDLRDPQAVWRSLVWDLDGSFNHGNPNWTEKFYIDQLKGFRGRLFLKLCQNDPDFRAYYRHFVEQKLKGSTSPDAIRGLIEKYRRIARSDVFADRQDQLLDLLDETERFVLHRAEMYLTWLNHFYRSL